MVRVMQYELYKQNQEEGSFESLVATFIVLTLVGCVFAFVKLSKAKKQLFAFGDSKLIPNNGLLKESKRNLKLIRKL